MEHGQRMILIGPTGAGKSTVGKLVAAQPGLPQHSLDELRHQYRPDFPLLPVNVAWMAHYSWRRAWMGLS